MIKHLNQSIALAKKYSYFLLLFFISSISYAQPPIAKKAMLSVSSQGNTGLFGTQAAYTENVGQYGDTLAGYTRMGKILYGYEGLGMPVLFTSKGLIHLQRLIKIPSREEMEREERRNKRKGEREEKEERKVTDKTITMEWLNANPNPEIVTEDVTQAYYTYGLLPKKARAFKKLIYKDLYPGIDVEYSFIPGKKAGFEYSLHIKPGADMSVVKMRYGGDVKKMGIDKEGNLVIRSSVDGIIQSELAGYISSASNKSDTFKMSFLSDKNIISFKQPAEYSKEETLVIDPFVTSTNNLTGINSGKAKDIDFDYAGNVYVSGGGSSSNQQLTKFDAAGTLLWTFSGSLSTPFWNFGGNYGGWVVEKTTGKIFLGQGIVGFGFSVIRLATTGVYDNYITTPNALFGENWKMIYSCHSGAATILVAGGGGSANNELALLSPPALVPAASNISGLSGGHNDISDIVIDPLSDDMYTIFSTPVTMTGTDNKIYKHTPPYLSSTNAWMINAGYFALREPGNRPYMSGFDNSSNSLAINSNYLFYWDGKNLKAITKATGTTAGTTSVPGNIILNQGGIYADECNNVFVGSSNGTIKVFKFTGASFDDAVVADITIPGFNFNSVYDLAYDNGKGLLYACGFGFVASFDISSYCPSTIYAVTTVGDCSTSSATCKITPLPPAGTTINYVLYDGTAVIASNTTGIFSNLASGINYTVKAFLNQACGGTQAAGNFIINAATPVITHNPAMICMPATVDLTDPSITAGTAAGLIFSYWSDANVTIPYTTPKAAPAGTYYIKGITTTGCYSVSPVTVPAFPVPIADAGIDTTVCFGKNVQLNGSGGLLYSWTPVTYLDNPAISNPQVIKPNPGSIIYHLVVTDMNGCKSLKDEQVKITVTTPRIFIGNDTIVAINQPLQLNAIDVTNSGFINYSWSPSYGLNNTSIPNPVAILDRDITYSLAANTANDCNGFAVIHVKVYKGPEIYVPTAFTPGGDGLNDILKVIPVGIKVFHYFSIYNRLGQLVFTTSDPNKGWDGKVQGIMQSSGVFVWMTEAEDYKGNTIWRKGTCTLIR